ncbi:MAG: sigma 54-interacting transcriptional regulator [Myxococcota bacterium]
MSERHFPVDAPLPAGAPDPQRTEPLPLPAPGAPPALLLRVESPERRNRARCLEGPLIVGSGFDSDLRLGDRSVSGHHLRLTPTGGAVCLEDLGSRNGTWVDGRRVGRLEVGPGTRVRVGRTDLLIVAVPEPESRARGLVAASAAMQTLLDETARLARLPWPVLVLGESGAGKEGIARALHTEGPRREGPFVALNAGGLAPTLVESELFGHERGAFTGASQRRLGAFERADGGTLFLDEVGELPLPLQARLLRVLEEWRIRRLGAEQERSVDVRLVCATHRDLAAWAFEGRFRPDLLYRIRRLVLEVPPLRARLDDVGPLAMHFLAGLGEGLAARALTDGAVARLRAHPWPGNVRELRNVVEAAAAHATGPVLDAEAIERSIRRVGMPLASPACSDAQLREVLAAHGGNVTAAARALGMPRSTFRGRLRRVA